MKFAAIIPARYSSERFPGKPLALLQGKPVIWHVYMNVRKSNLFDQVIVATDDKRIADAVQAFGGICKMTSPHHLSGSDRVAEAAIDLDCDVIFNVQGDEPMIETAVLAKLKDLFKEPEVQVASLMTPITDTEELNNANLVKVVTDYKMNALYFSRSPIPYNRDGKSDVKYFRHIGVYAYCRQTLLDFVKLEPGKLEQAEKLEQLRFLEHGIPIRMAITSYHGIGIDTPEDLAAAEKLLTHTF